MVSRVTRKYRNRNSLVIFRRIRSIRDAPPRREAHMTRQFLRIAAVLVTAFLLTGRTEALTIYPVDRAEILVGSKFDFKVEFDGVVSPSDIRVTVNGVDHAKAFGRAAQFTEKEQGVEASAVLLRDLT